MNTHHLLATLALLSAMLPAVAQPEWTAQSCMRYAVEHNHDVRQAALSLDNQRAARVAAVGRWLPSVDAGVGVQYNFGRAIDPETNTYTDVSTFYNGYSVSASLPLFDGFGRYHALQAARAGELMGREALRCRQDEVALATLQAYVDVCYDEGTVALAAERLDECDLLLRQTRLLVDVGRKSQADLAQIEAQRAEADFELTRQQNLLESARLELKKAMGLALGEAVPSHLSPWQEETPAGAMTPLTDLPGEATAGSPLLLQAYHSMQTALHEWRQARAALYPSLSLGTGINTTFYKTLHRHTAPSFAHQFRNNMGEYVALSLSIPLFNRLQTLTSVRRAKNNYLMAREAYAQRQLELEKLQLDAQRDVQAYARQTAQMLKKVEADSLSYQLTRRQYEEGLATAIDLHTTSAQLLQSRATLLQCRLMQGVKACLARYYRGEPIW